MIYLPCMTLMQTCLMCRSVGALPWDRKKKKREFIHRTIKKTLLNGNLTDSASGQVAGFTKELAHTAKELMSGLAWLPAPLLVLWDGVSKGKPRRLPTTHWGALDARQAGGTLLSLHASRSRRSSRSFHSRKPPTSFGPPQAGLPRVTHLEQNGTL